MANFMDILPHFFLSFFGHSAACGVPRPGISQPWPGFRPKLQVHALAAMPGQSPTVPGRRWNLHPSTTQAAADPLVPQWQLLPPFFRK